ncbi:MAG TPA: flagellar hook-length control protein FliK [Spirochaetota bacterium]|nr:flagellar hook-length control protein FliK [Spirochaetota bacterium]HPP03776.1 flagellar hook-length control protein FliK [Spirochaetota bacterium]
MLNSLEMLVKTNKINEPAKQIEIKDLNNDNKEFAILFENMLNGINNVEKIEKKENIENEKYKIEITLDNKEISKEKTEINSNKENKYDHIVVKNGNNLDNSGRMSLFLGKLNNYFKENLENIVANKRVEPEVKKIEIKLSNLQFHLKEKIRESIDKLSHGKIDQNEFKTILKNVISSHLVKDLNIKDNIKDIRVKKSDKIENDKNKIKKFDEKIEIKDNISFDKEKSSIKNEIKVDNENNQIKDKNDLISHNKKDAKTKIEEYFTKIKEDTKSGESKQDITNSSVNIEKSMNNEVKKGFDVGQKVPVENKKELFDTIVKNTKILLTNNETKFSTMVRPESLGRMDFHINIKDGQLNAKIIVHTKDAFDFFRSNVEDLRAVFQKSNVEFGKIDIALAGQMDSFNQTLDFMNGNFNNNDLPYKEISGFNSHYSRYENKEIEQIQSKFSNNYSDSKINLFI